jgi:hypothetical protein
MLTQEDFIIILDKGFVNTHPWGYIYSCKGFHRILTFARMLTQEDFIILDKGFDRILTFARMLTQEDFIILDKGFIRILTFVNTRI